MIVLFFLGATLYAFPGQPDEQTDTVKYKSYYGKVVDFDSKRTLPFATIEALGSNTATVTNIDGNFTIKIDPKSTVSQLKISYVGFQNKIVNLADFKDDRSYTVELVESSIQLKQVTIRPKDATELINNVLYNIRTNYSERPMMMRGFTHQQ